MKLHSLVEISEEALYIIQDAINIPTVSPQELKHQYHIPFTT